MSASQPHTTDPATVPDSAANGSQATVALLTTYSARMPGKTKPRLAGFITSITSATVNTTIRRQCAATSGASSGAATCSNASGAACWATRRGNRP
jgi:hypothetical protein